MAHFDPYPDFGVACMQVWGNGANASQADGPVAG